MGDLNGDCRVYQVFDAQFPADSMFQRSLCNLLVEWSLQPFGRSWVLDGNDEGIAIEFDAYRRREEFSERAGRYLAADIGQRLLPDGGRLINARVVY